MKLKQRLKEYEHQAEIHKGVIRILEADVKKARREGAEDLARSLMLAYDAYDKEHMVSVGNVLEDIRFFSRKYVEVKSDELKQGYITGQFSGGS